MKEGSIHREVFGLYCAGNGHCEFMSVSMNFLEFLPEIASRCLHDFQVHIICPNSRYAGQFVCFQIGSIDG